MAIDDYNFKYSFDGDYVDDGTNGDAWTYGTSFVTFDSRQHVLIDASGDAVLLNSSISSGTIGVSLWHKGAVGSTTYRFILGVVDNNGCLLCIRESDNMIGHYHNSNGFYSSGVALTDGDMTHFVVSKDGTSIKIWKDKILIYDDATASSSMSNFRGIGNQGWTNSRENGANGSYKEAYGFTHTLTSTDVSDLYDLDAPPLIPEAIANIGVTASAEALRYIPMAMANVHITASAQVTFYTPICDGNVSVTASAEAQAVIAESTLFTFTYTIQQAQAESKFKFVYSIEQPKVPRIIIRVNV